MATPAQIEANRANALKSTGPRTPEGKAASRLNALKHGLDAVCLIIPGEDPAAFEELAAEYFRELTPATILERFEVNTVVRCDWQRRRLARIEANLYRELLAEGTSPEEIDVTILRDSPTGKLLLKVQAQIAGLERTWRRALADLSRLRRDAPQPQPPAAQAEPPAESVRTPLALLSRNEPNFPPKPAPSRTLDNPALRL